MKLIQFTDTHLRLSPPPQSQFHVQPFWRDETPEIFSRIAKIGADAILFTGDAAHGGGGPEVDRFFELLSKSFGEKPIFMVLGNHDVTNPNWEQNFHRGLERHKNIRMGDGVYQQGEIDIALIDNEYLTGTGEIVPTWPESFFPIPAMSTPRAEKLNAGLSTNSQRPAIVMVHCPSHVLPATVYDFSSGVFTGMTKYREVLHGVLDNHPRAGLVLSGHVHFSSTRIFNHGRVHQSLASTAEYPFHIRTIEINNRKCRTKLISLANESETEEEINFA